MIYLTGSRNPAMDHVGRLGGEFGDTPVGLLVTPGSAGMLAIKGIQNAYAWVGIDNGCFSEAGRALFTVEKFAALAKRALELWGDYVLFIAVPDVPFDWVGTLAKFNEHAATVRTMGVPIALVTQDGATPEQIPWAEIDAIFVGGSDDWKMGTDSAAICKEARRRGKWVHVGRVNSAKRMNKAATMGADSADGTYLKYAKPTTKEAHRVVAWATDATELAARQANPTYNEADFMVNMGHADEWAAFQYQVGY